MDALQLEMEILKNTPKDMRADLTEQVIGADDLSDILDATPAGANQFQATSQPQPQPSPQPFTAPYSQPQQQQGKISLASLVPASTAVKLADMVIPAVMVALFRMLNKKTVHKSAFKLNQEEQDILKEPLENYLKSVMIDPQNPSTMLLITLGCIYGTKFIDMQNSKGGNTETYYREPIQNDQSGKKETRGRKPGTKKGVDFK